jgi:hypothetical protein
MPWGLPHGVAYRIPAREVARGHAAQRNGMELERLLNPDAAPPELFQEMTVGFVLGLTSARRSTAADDGRDTG